MPANPCCPLCKRNRDVHQNYQGVNYYCGNCNHTFQTPVMPQCKRCGTCRYVTPQDLPDWFTCSKCSYTFQLLTPLAYYGLNEGFVSALAQKLNPQRLPEGPMYLVVNSALQPMSLVQQGFIKTLTEEETALVNKEGTNTLAIPNKEIATKFAEWLASKNQGQRYYLFELVDYVQTQDPPVKWSKQGQ
jgi:hypothetical protein